MKKFIASQNGLNFAIETDGDQTRFFGLEAGSSYSSRKDVTPVELPNKTIINEIIARPTMGDAMSRELQGFVDELECNYRSGS
ncbi:MAG: hypothetical protein IJ689_03570 [Alphaproteobacteria bacterium]|nr:hypothetical protein [Alphaproteobacteria bacterium]